ncbi:GNAT family N-acetyltransferase [Rhizobium puerariae]|uniref:GNAT family N-acetyltransferase n=1 Tax=Rhizobium puerariae TaxID=1585791 RepID=A0ABV6AMY4_9HYPH
MNVGIEPASAGDRPYLRDLLSRHLEELSRYGNVDLNYRYFDAYWKEPEGRWPYLIRENSRPTGFAFVNTWSPSGRGTDFSIAEFYVVPDARMRGIGRGAARALLRTRSGIWEVNVMTLNATAQKFWPRALDAAGAKDMERIEVDRETVYRFRIA